MTDDNCSLGAQLEDTLLHVTRLRSDIRAFENERETTFELLRQSVRNCARFNLLDSLNVKDSQIEDAWLFLLELRKVNPSRRRRIEEVTKALLRSPSRWSRVLHDSQHVQDACRRTALDVKQDLWSLPSEAEEMIEREKPKHRQPAAEWPNLSPQKTRLKSPWPPPSLTSKTVSSMNPFEHHPVTKFKTMSPKATAGSDLFAASLADSCEEQSSDTAPKILESNETDPPDRVRQGMQAVGSVSLAAGQGALAAVSKAREINQKYAFTDKMSDGITTAVSKTREVNDRYAISDNIGQVLHKAVAKTASNISGRNTSSNPFSQGQVNFTAGAAPQNWPEKHGAHGLSHYEVTLKRNPFLQ